MARACRASDRPPTIGPFGPFVVPRHPPTRSQPLCPLPSPALRQRDLDRGSTRLAVHRCRP
eukprot:scaffold201_cov405-Prasinococcus_capsulatus_cf.AAC.62